MGVAKKETRIKKLENQIKKYESSNPKMAQRIKGRLANFKGKKK
jgi:hypothetical protein